MICVEGKVRLGMDEEMIAEGVKKIYTNYIDYMMVIPRMVIR